MHDLLQLVLSEVRSAWRFRWQAVLVAWIAGLVGLGVVAWLPNVYEASARVYVDVSSVLRPLLTDRIVAPDVATQLLYVRQALLGREHLERIARETGLDADASTPAEIQKVLDNLGGAIDIQAAPADPRDRSAINNVFTITYQNHRRDVAIAVVSSLTNALIEDTLAANREGTDRAARFLDQQIADLEARLQLAERARADFQRDNAGKLPGSEESYFERMQRERDALDQTQRDLRIAQSKRERLRQQLTSEAPLVADDPSLDREPRPNSLDARIRDQRANLDRLMLRYTDRHPEVIATKDSLTRLEEVRAEQLRALGVADPNIQISALGANPVYQAVQIALNDVDVQISTLEADVRDREQRLRDLQALINEVPGIEAEFARLNRDYDVIRDQYQALTQSRERQQLSEQASATDQPDFRVLNPPNAEFEPVAPPRLLLLVAVLAAALTVGAGVSYLLAQLRPVFSNLKQLREVSGFPVIGTVSRIVADPRAIARRRRAFASFTAAVVALVLIVGAAAIYEISGPGIHSLLGGGV